VTNPLAQHHLTFMRDQRTPMVRIGQHLKSLTRALFYEAVNELNIPIAIGEFRTPEPEAHEGESIFLDSTRYALIAIMRTGVGMVGAVHDLLESAGIGHAYYEEKDGQYIPRGVNLPILDDRFIFIFDSAIISGNTVIQLLKELVDERGVEPERIAIITSTVTPPSIEAIAEAMGTKSNPIKIITAAVDALEQGDRYPNPGFGSMRKRLYGEVQERGK